MGDPQLTLSGFSTKMVLLSLCLFGSLGAVVAKSSSRVTTKYVYPGTDLAGVQALREAWNNTPNASTTLKNWGANEDPCGVASGVKWAGVDGWSFWEDDQVITDPAGNITVKRDAAVTDLAFRGTSLKGTLPPQISWLSGLTDLYLTNNPDLSGLIPKEIELLTKLNHIDLSGNSLSGELPNANLSMLYGLFSMNISRNCLQGSIKQDYFQGLNFLNELDLSVNNFTGLCPNLSYWTWMTNLNISCNNFTGPFPDFRSTPFLETLFLDNNRIEGTLDISKLVASTLGKNLNVLSLRNNNIAKVVSTNDLLQGVRMKIFLQGNPLCNRTWPSEAEATRCSRFCEHDCIYKPNPKSQKWKVILFFSIGSFVVVFVLVVMAFAFVLHWNQRYTQDLLRVIKQADVCAKRFEYNQLRAATKNFAPEMKLGAGAFGAVYKGILENNVVVAVKQLFLETSEGKDNFLNKVFLISNLQHRNLVTLRGYCLHGKQTLLIYDFVDNCDLDKVLLSRHNLASDTFDDLQMKMMWPAQMKVCQGVAQGLFYLHASSQSRIIHRDIKASNILLDKSFHPKIADFGLARPMEDTKSIIYTQQCAGTMGYLAPEYACNGELSDKADVFSFGVLLLEIVSGKRNTDVTMPDDEVYLPNLAKKLHRQNRLMDLQDASLLVSSNEALEVQQVLEIAMLCVQNAPERRPTMFRVAAMLEGDAKVQALVSNDDLSQDMTCISVDSESECLLFPLSSSTSRSDRGPLTNGNATLELSIMHNGR